MPISQEVAYWSVVASKAIKEGKFTSRELLELTIERIESVNPELNAVVTTDLDLARKLADEADAKLKAGAVVWATPRDTHHSQRCARDSRNTLDWRSNRASQPCAGPGCSGCEGGQGCWRDRFG